MREFECVDAMEAIMDRFKEGTVGGPDFFNQDLP